tara:strand:- start:2834 stop:4312 length:1479 start_codon:yes stop_codon:yes gene_type:complete
MPLIPLEIPAGQFRNGTELQSSGRWNDGSLVRWHGGAMMPVGGWRQRGDVDISGVVRGMLSWRDNNQNRFLALGTSGGLFVMEEDDDVFDITPAGFTSGRVDASVNSGYGGGNYGLETYGTSRQDSFNLLNPTTWALDTWGEYLVGCTPDDGNLYEWQLNTASPAAIIANAPTNNTSLVVTEERFLFALGAGGNPRKVQWCDKEDNTAWTPSATNEAGDILLQTSGEIVSGIRTRGETIILTTTDCHVARYSGPPFVFGFERAGDSCGVIGPKASASIDLGVVWMGTRGFHLYSGGAVQDLACDVSDYVFSSMNRDQISKVYAVVNSAWREVWWFYPSGDGIECDRYVAYDYAENVWMTGNIDRTAGVDTGTFRQPMWIAANGELYEHETGNQYGTNNVFVESGPISIGVGEKVMKVTSLIPDEKTQGDVTATFKTRFYPNGTESSFGPYNMSNPTPVRFTGRQMRMRVNGTTNSDWRVGVMRVEAVEGGKR